MSKRYIILTILLLGTSFGLMYLPEKTDYGQIKPEQFLYAIDNPARIVSTDFVAKRLIERDPSLFLVDVRSEFEYNEYSIPGAFNIPLESIASEEYADYIDQPGMDVVFFSNGGVYADQAWALAAQLGIENIYVMKGGLNHWFATIIKPVAPPETAPTEAFDKYAFRRAACIYFGGASAGIESAGPVTKKTVTVRKKKKKEAEGGC